MAFCIWWLWRMVRKECEYKNLYYPNIIIIVIIIHDDNDSEADGGDDGGNDLSIFKHIPYTYKN